jgi:hypothetical protein
MESGGVDQRREAGKRQISCEQCDSNPEVDAATGVGGSALPKRCAP